MHSRNIEVGMVSLLFCTTAISFVIRANSFSFNVVLSGDVPVLKAWHNPCRIEALSSPGKRARIFERRVGKCIRYDSIKNPLFLSK